MTWLWMCKGPVMVTVEGIRKGEGLCKCGSGVISNECEKKTERKTAAN